MVTAAIPSKNAEVVALTKVSADGPTLSSDYAYFKMHEQYATAAIVEDDSPDAIFSSFTLNNAPDWATNPGWLTASTASGGSGKQRASTTAEQNFLRTDTLTGSLLISAWVQCPDAINGGYIISFGNSNSSPEDEWNFGLASTKKATVQYKAVNLGALTTFSSGEILHVGAIIDCANENVYVYQYGVQANTPQPITKLTALPAVTDAGFLLRANATTGSLEYGESSTTTTYDQLISDLLIIRFDTDESANFDAYMAALAAAPRGTLPAILDGK